MASSRTQRDLSLAQWDRGDKNLEDFGYLMEEAILFATGLGLGTCWLGGSFTKSGLPKR